MRDRRRLTARESTIADMVGRGWTNQQIAEELGLAVQTVKRHVSHVLIKWDLRNRTQIAIRQVRNEERERRAGG